MKRCEERLTLQLYHTSLSQIVRGLTKLIELQAKRHKEQIQFAEERDQAFLEFKIEQVEKNSKHELEIAKIFASSMSNSQQQGDFIDTPFNQASLFQHLIRQAACFMHVCEFHITTCITTDVTYSTLSCNASTSFLTPHSLKYKINIELTHFRPIFPFLYPLNMSENRRFSDVFSELSKGTLA